MKKQARDKASEFFTHPMKFLKLEAMEEEGKFRFRVYQLVSDDVLDAKGLLEALKFLAIDFEQGDLKK